MNGHTRNFLYLIIYIVFSSTLLCQDLELKLQAEKPIPGTLLDSINPTINFDDYNSLQQESVRILQSFQQLGYLSSNLDSLNRKNDTIIVATYFLGNRTKSIVIDYSSTNLQKKEIATYFKNVTDSSFIVPVSQLESKLAVLNQAVTATGNPFARLRLTNLRIDNTGNVIADLELSEGPSRTLDSIAIKGYEKFPRSFLRYQAGIRKGKPFSRRRLIRQNELLDNLPFVATTKPPEVLFRKDSTIAYLYLEKENNNTFDGILGFATDADTQEFQLNGYLNLALNNNLNYGESLLINYKADGGEQQNFRARISLPYLFKSPFGVTGELKIFKRDTSFVTTEQLARMDIRASPTLSFFAGYKGYESNNLQEGVIVGNTVIDFTSKFFTAGGNYEVLQRSRLFPVKATIGITSEIGERELRGITEPQTRLHFNGSYIFSLNNTNSIYLKNETGILFSDTYITNELFRFGGIQSLRGFDENSIDASVYSTLMTEYRFTVSDQFFVHSIIDAGYFENSILSISENLYGFGFGIGFITKTGLFRLNVANGISNQQDFDISGTKVHLSLQSNF